MLVKGATGIQIGIMLLYDLSFSPIMTSAGIIPTILAAMLLYFANQVDTRAPYIIGK